MLKFIGWVLRTLLVLVIGFALYPLALPFLAHWFPDLTDKWIHVYADYVRFVGDKLL